VVNSTSSDHSAHTSNNPAGSPPSDGTSNLHTWIVFCVVVIGIVAVVLIFLTLPDAQKTSQALAAAVGAIGTLAGFALA
jgi:uncharacterized BrkB/YihY/UPF0761 family membrane protein